MNPQSSPASPPSPLTFAQAGAGRDVILIHGAMTGLEDMAIALFAVLETEFRVTAVDRPGHGASPAMDTPTVWRQAQAVHGAAEALGLERPVVVGHSFGASVALAYAQLYPGETAGVVALAPIAFPEPRLEHLLFAPRGAPGPFGFWSHSLASLYDPILLPVLWRTMFLPQPMPDRFARLFPFDRAGRPGQMRAEGLDAALMVAGVAWNTAGYGACETPVHVMTGDRDLVVNPAVHARGLALALPQARLTTLTGLGHMVHHFAQAPIAEAIWALHAGR